jgi:hypothetical protein
VSLVSESPSDSTEHILARCVSHSRSRPELWTEFIRSTGLKRMAEVGVYRGDFAAAVLQSCPSLSAYYMIDPWKHLEDWNKPANQDDAVFEQFFQEAKAKTDFAAGKRVILRGKTTEVIEQIPDGELDFAYIDADHTLRGVTIDLIRVYPKVRAGGFLGGDDFCQTMWQHKTSFEPSLVFPFAVYFAEAVGATIYGLPYGQFLLQKAGGQHFAFVDLTHTYGRVELRDQLAPASLLKLVMKERFPRLTRATARARRFLVP